MIEKQDRELVCPESTVESAPRRSFIRKAAVGAAALGIGGALLGSGKLPRSYACTGCSGNKFEISGALYVDDSPACESEYSFVPALQSTNWRNCCTSSAVAGYAQFGKFRSCTPPYFTNKIPVKPTGVAGYSWCGPGVTGWSDNNSGVVGSSQGITPNPPGNVGVYGQVTTGVGIQGVSPCGTGVFGCSAKGIGVDGASSCGTGVYGKGKDRGVFGYSVSGCGVYGCSACGIGVAGVSTSRSGVYGKSAKKYGVRGCSKCCAGIYGVGGTYGVQGCSTNNSGRHVGVVGNTGYGNGSAGVAGYASGGCGCSCTVTAGVYGQSEAFRGQGVSGLASSVSGTGVGVIGQSNSSCGIGVVGQAGHRSAVPLVARGILCQSTNLQEWQAQRVMCCVFPEFETVSVVNKCGWIGAGATDVPTTLTVGGSLSAKTVIATANYNMGSSDFAVLASGKIKVTLPPASTAMGMIVFVKNISKSTVTIDAFTNSTTEIDTIEGAASKRLKKQYDSLQLISNGSDEWFVLGNSICAAFTS